MYSEVEEKRYVLIRKSRQSHIKEKTDSEISQRLPLYNATVAHATL